MSSICNLCMTCMGAHIWDPFLRYSWGRYLIPLTNWAQNAHSLTIQKAHNAHSVPFNYSQRMCILCPVCQGYYSYTCLGAICKTHMGAIRKICMGALCKTLMGVISKTCLRTISKTYVWGLFVRKVFGLCGRHIRGLFV